MIFKSLKVIVGLLPIVAFVVISTAASAESILLGDANGDGAVTIVDATAVQMWLAEYPTSGSFSKTAADVDGNGEIEITDATLIQKWLAELAPPYRINELIEIPSDATEPATQPTSEQATQTPEAPTQRPTDEEGWGRDIFQP